MDDLIADFIAETREGLEALDSELVRFEQNPDDPELLGGIFRLIHTIKGTCGFLSLTRLQSVAHAAENVLGAFRDGELAVTPAAVSAILETVDLIRSLIDALGVDGTEPAGDDSALIGRLEAILRADAPAAPTAPPASQPLIERLGGDATLDAACEMMLDGLQGASFGGAFQTFDRDELQGLLRDELIEAARSNAATAFPAGLGADRPDLAAGAKHLLSDALATLEIEPSPIAELLDRLTIAAPPSAPSHLPPETMPKPPAPRPSASDVEPAQPAQTIRVSVDALEQMMTVVSELVLIRNQLIQTLRLDPESPFAAPLHRLNQVTSELQEGVMTTRMQPISGAWAKLPRLVRDLSQDLGKTIDLVMSGEETELDRQVLELIKDPLTHMIRNAADHGLEMPDERLAAGKPATGRITLAARHEGGAIVIEIADDGRGLSASKIRAKAVSSGLIAAGQADSLSEAEIHQLIFAAGFSTAGEVTSVSGRGVGMDVVRTNIEKIGGVIEMSSQEGVGSRFVIRIPLTLTIVQALIVECCGERFALPQSAVVELVSANEASAHKIEYVHGAAVLRLRDRLLPLISLQSLLKLDADQAVPGETCIIVARVGGFSFGVVVDRVFDTEEIVVKPVSSILRHLKLYSGATILGDGSVILILDPKGLSIETGADQASSQTAQEDAVTVVEDRSTILVFRAANDALKAAPLSAVSRIEEIEAPELETVDGRTVIQYRGRLMPVIGSDGGQPARWDGDERRPLLVFTREDRAIGLLVKDVVDIVEVVMDDELEPTSPGAAGSLIINEVATELIDVAHYWQTAIGLPAANTESGAPARQGRVLIIDQSPFTQMLLRPLLAKAGYEVTVAPTAQAALALHQAGKAFHMILADTSRADAVQSLAKVLAEAVDWHATPLLRLDSQSAGELAATSMVAAVSETFDDLRGAA